MNPSPTHSDAETVVVLENTACKGNRSFRQPFPNYSPIGVDIEGVLMQGTVDRYCASA